MQIRTFKINSNTLLNEKVPVKHLIQHITYSKNANMANSGIYCLFINRKINMFYLGYKVAI